MNKILVRLNIAIHFNIAILIASLIACVSSPPVPDWVTGKSQKYTSQSYMTAHGIDATKQSAFDKAQLSLTQQFKSLASTAEQTSQINIIINQIEFEKPWKNFETNDFHVLAFLSREKISSLVQKKMLALDELTYEFFERAKGTSDLLEQSSYIDSALDAQIRRSKLKPTLLLINGQSDFPSSYDIKRLTKIRDTLLRRINLQIKIVEQPITEGLVSVLKTKLETIGFIRDENKYSQNHLLIEIKYALSSELNQQVATGYLLQGVLNTSLKNDKNQSIRGTHNWTFNLTAQDKKTAMQRVSQLLIKQINENLKHVVMAMMVEEDDEPETPNYSDSDFADIDMPEFNQTENQKPIKNPTKSSNNNSNTVSKISNKDDKTTAVSKNSGQITDTLNTEQTNQTGAKTLLVPSSSAPNDKTVATDNSKNIEAITANQAPAELKPKNETAQSETTTIVDDPVSSLPPLEPTE